MLLLLLELSSGLLQAVVAFLIGAAGTETDADQGRPGTALEEQNGEDDTEAEAEGRLDDQVGQAAVPLGRNVSDGGVLETI